MTLALKTSPPRSYFSSLQDSYNNFGGSLPKIGLMGMVIAITQNAHYTNDLEPNYLQSKDNFKAPQPKDSYGCSTDI